MKKYNITVNGNSYEVEVEEIGGAPGLAPVAVPASAPAAAPAPAASAASAPAASAAAPSAEATVVESPMPGTIMNVMKKAGDSVANGDVVLILEAMKMENEIVSPAAGVIDTVAVTKGTAVNAGDLLFSIK